MTESVRTERRYGVTAQLTTSQRMHLLRLREQEEGWDVLLDIWEQTIIEMESEHFNRKPEDEKGILADHKKIQAAWQMFQHFQQKVQEEVEIYKEGMQPKEVDQEPEDYEALLQVVEPFNEHPEMEE